ncbi:MAG: hypothetical protein PHQ54_00095 [Candidatus Omnitrophica bacterium]|nr:hypothetical protein [Candidatus Omnitrophota bacterium]
MAVKIINYDQSYNFIVIDKGTIHGIEPGMKFTVIKDGVEIGQIEIVKAKDNVSACDVREMMVGANLKSQDIITIYPYGATLAPKDNLKMQDRRETKEGSSELKPKKTPRSSRFSIPADVEGRSIQEVMWAKDIDSGAVSIDILANPDFSFYILRDVMEENKIIITNSNRLKGTMTGFKNVPLNFFQGIFADFTASKERKVVYDVLVENTGPNTCRINIGIRFIAYTKNDAASVKSVSGGR